MGEAKRRKKLDPNYGKANREGISAIDRLLKMFEQGKGKPNLSCVLSNNSKGYSINAIDYVRSNLNQIEIPANVEAIFIMESSSFPVRDFDEYGEKAIDLFNRNGLSLNDLALLSKDITTNDGVVENPNYLFKNET